jgi:hypothetical protein
MIKKETVTGTVSLEKSYVIKTGNLFFPGGRCNLGLRPLGWYV